MNEVDTTKFGWADYGVFVLMLVMSTGIGLYHGFKVTFFNSNARGFEKTFGYFTFLMCVQYVCP